MTSPFGTAQQWEKNNPPGVGVGSAPLRASFTSDFTALADGAPPTIADSAQQIRYVTNGAAGADAIIASGRLTNTVTAATPAAFYATSKLGGNVKNIGAEFSFAPGTTDGGSAALVIWAQDITDTFPTLPDAALHLTVTTKDWGVGFFQGGSLVDPGFAGTFAESLPTDGTLSRVNVQLEDDKCYLLLPDGSTAVFQDSRFRSITGQFACFEVFQNEASTDAKAKFARVWADVQQVGSDRAQISLGDLANAVTTVRSQVRPRTVYLDTGSGSSNLPGSSGPTDPALAISDLIVPDSGKVLVEFSGFLTMVSAARVFWVINFGGTTDWVTQEVLNDAVGNFAGVRTLRAVASGLSPGQIVDLRWYHWSTVLNSGYLALDNAGGHQACITVSPVD